MNFVYCSWFYDSEYVKKKKLRRKEKIINVQILA
jgi:hypothetical protein